MNSRSTREFLEAPIERVEKEPTPLEQRFEQLRQLDRKTNGALSSFSRERPYLFSLLKRIGEREAMLREQLMFPATRSPGVTEAYLAGALMMCGVIKQTISADNLEAKDLELMNKANEQIFGGSDGSV